MKEMLINLGNAAAEYLRMKGLEPYAINKFTSLDTMIAGVALVQRFSRGGNIAPMKKDDDAK